MKQLFFLLFFIINTLNASILIDKIENLIGIDQLKLHNKLIKLLFNNKNDFYISDKQLDYQMILKTLKENGLLKLKFKSPKEFNIQFSTNSDAIKSLKILNETLKTMGYYYYFTKSTNFNAKDNSLDWTISFNTEYTLDPYLLVQELKTKNCQIIDIQKINNRSWKYKIDVNNAKIQESIKVDNGERIIFQKPLRPYFIEVSNATKLQVISRKLNHWFPYVAFYDKHLNILKVIKKDRVYRGYKTSVPRETKYIKISDVFTLINIKRGLSIIVK